MTSEFEEMVSESNENLEVSPRIVLMLLNQMNITEVTACQLKAFVYDLKKLIKIDRQYSKDTKENISPGICTKAEGPERLYSCSTFSSRSKVVQDKVKNSSDNRNKNVPSNARKSVHHIKKGRSQSIVNIEVDTATTSRPDRATTAPRKMKSSKNFIKVSEEERYKKSDPVYLYHFYASLWQKYKDRLPGENDWSDLRWSVREKMSDRQNQNSKKAMTVPSEEYLAKRREGWID